MIFHYQRPYTRNRIGIHLPTVCPEGSPPVAVLGQLQNLGFWILKTDPYTYAYDWVGKTIYQRGAQIRHAPSQMDCSSFVVWFYAELGIHMPRYSIDQARQGHAAAYENLRAGDLIFRKCVRGNFPYQGEKEGLGHVGIVSDRASILHATGRYATTARPGKTLVEDPIPPPHRIVAIRRILPVEGFYTLLLPKHIDINSTDDLRSLLYTRQK